MELDYICFEADDGFFAGWFDNFSGTRRGFCPSWGKARYLYAAKGTQVF
jgi:hypothetical protein